MLTQNVDDPAMSSIKTLDEGRWAKFLESINPLTAACAIVGLAGTVASVATLVLPFYGADGQPNWGYVLEFFVWVNGVLLIVAAFSLGLALSRSHQLRRYKKKEYEENVRYGLISNQINSIFSKGSNTLEYLYAVKDDDPEDCQKAEAIVRQHCQYIIDNLLELFRILTKYNCSISIKILFLDESKDGESDRLQLVYTYARDSISAHERGRVDHVLTSYPYSDNTAFADIMDPDKPDFFLSNDLRALGEEYKNSDPDWKKYYNSTVVVPIKKPAGVESIDTVGFLCVDNMHGGFSHDFSINMLHSVACLFYSIFSMFCKSTFSEYVPRGDGP